MASGSAQESAPEQKKLSSRLAAEAKAEYGAAEGVVKSRASSFCDDWIVDQRSFDGAPPATLMCARALRCLLMFFVIMSVTGLIVGFILRKGGGFTMGGEQVKSLEAPSPVLCPSPWGSNFSNFEIFAVSIGVVPGGDFHKVEHKVKPFSGSSSPTLAGCKHVHIHEVLSPHGKPGQYDAFETVRVSFRASTDDGSYNFGFTNTDGPVPQRWSYGPLGYRLTGEIGNDNTIVGGNDFADGTPHATLIFKPSGEKNITSADGGSGATELEFFYGYFMVRVLGATADSISFFAVVTFILLLAAAVNNYGLYDFVFVEQSDGPQEPTKLEPNVLFRVLCGPCGCCKGRPADAEEGDGKASA